MKRRLFVVAVLFFCLFLNPPRNQASKISELSKNKVTLGTISPELREAYQRMNSLGFRMSKVAKELKDSVRKLSKPTGWKAGEVESVYDTLDNAVIKVDSLDEKARKAFTDFEKELERSSFSSEIVEKHRKFVEDYKRNYKKFSAINENLLSSRTNIINKRKGVPVLKVDYDRDVNARKEVTHELAKLNDFLDAWYVDGARKDTAPDTDKDAPKPWRNIFMKPRKPKQRNVASKQAPPQSYKALRANAELVGSSGTLAQTIDTESVAEILAMTTVDQALKSAVDSADTIAIYEWVLNNIEYQPYYGSAKGAAKTYFDRAGNDFDTASLLIGLLRTANIPSRYVYGTIRLTPEQANNMFGSDSAVTAATIIARGGTPVQWDGFDMLVEHCWVEAYVPYDNYRGSGAGAGGETWIPLDASQKKYSYTPGLQIAKDVAFDWKSFFENGITDKTAVEVYKDTIADYVAAYYPDKTIDDVPMVRTIVPENLGILPLSLPYEVESVHTEYSEIPDALHHKARYKLFPQASVPDHYAPTTLDVTLYTSEILSKRTTIAWVGATPDDQAIIDSFGGLFSTPIYLIHVKAKLMVNGIARGESEPIGFFSKLLLKSFAVLPAGVQIEGTGNEWDEVYNISAFNLQPGETVGIGQDFYGYSDEYLQMQFDTLQANKASTNYDDVFGQLTYLNSVYYYNKTFKSNKLASDLRHLTNYPNQMSFCVIRMTNKAGNFMGGTLSFLPSNYVTDGGASTNLIPLHNENVDDEFSKIMGCATSQLEGFMYRDLYGMPPVSAVTIIQHAYTQGVPVENGWTDDNPATDDIIIGSACTPAYLDYYKWHGTAWIANDTTNCPGRALNPGYRISGGLNGGSGGDDFGLDISGALVQADTDDAMISGRFISIEPNKKGITAEVYESDGTTLIKPLDELNDIIYAVDYSNEGSDINKVDFKLGALPVGNYWLKTSILIENDLIRFVMKMNYENELEIEAINTEPSIPNDFFTDGVSPRPSVVNATYIIPYWELSLWEIDQTIQIQHIYLNGELMKNGELVVTDFKYISSPGEYLICYTRGGTEKFWVKVFVMDMIIDVDKDNILIDDLANYTPGYSGNTPEITVSAPYDNLAVSYQSINVIVYPVSKTIAPYLTLNL